MGATATGRVSGSSSVAVLTAPVWGSGGKYADWATFLESWGQRQVGMEAAPGELQPADFDLATWDRLLTRVQNAVESRSALWASSLSSDLAQANDEFTMGRALARARHGLASIRALTEQPGLPTDLRANLREQIDGAIASWQGALEDGARRLRASGQTRLAESYLRAVRDNSLDNQPGESPARLTDPWASSLGTSRRTVTPD